MYWTLFDSQQVRMIHQLGGVGSRSRVIFVTLPVEWTAATDN